MAICETCDNLDGETHDCGHDHGGLIDPQTCMNDQTDRMRYERYRLESFAQWPQTANANKDELAKNGFYYIGNGSNDRVKCVFCHIILSNWEPGDNVTEEHKKHAPLCPYVKDSTHAGNFPLRYRRMESISVHHDGPRHREYSDRQIRFESFYNWPKKTPTAGELADAGFFYLGQGDTVKCYYCGGMLRHWEETDDVWEEHRKWFPLCLFVVEHDPEVHHNLHRHLHRTLSGIAISNGFTEETVEQFRGYLNENHLPHPDEYGEFRNQLHQFRDQLQPSGAQGSNEEKGTVYKSEEGQKATEFEDRYKCKVCYERGVEVIFYPCKHVCCCSKCSEKLDKCPVCRGTIKGKLQLFFP